MIVLDTNVVSELVDRQPEPAVLRWLDAQNSLDLVTTAVTAAELLYGIASLADGARKRDLTLAVEQLFDEYLDARVLSFDVDAASFYGEIVAARRRGGRPIAIADAQIAAICRLHGATLATRNERDFEGTGVSVFNPWN